MSQLLAAVRRYVNVSILKAFSPTNAWIEALRCEAWRTLVATAPHIRPGQLERACNEAIVRRTERAVRIPGFALAAPENDNARLVACRRCAKPIRLGDQGEWSTSLHGACENVVVAEALATEPGRVCHTDGPPPVAGYDANGRAYWISQNRAEES